MPVEYKYLLHEILQDNLVCKLYTSIKNVSALVRHVRPSIHRFVYSFALAAHTQPKTLANLANMHAYTQRASELKKVEEKLNEKYHQRAN